jgi:ribosomal protein L6P/L9E
MIKGVTENFEKGLELVGVGYRVKSISPGEISITVGFFPPGGVQSSRGNRV